jgi:hypothetical protein
MANVKILVMRDGETWETHYADEPATIVEIDEADFSRLCDGEVEIWDLERDGKIVSETPIKEDK